MYKKLCDILKTVTWNTNWNDFLNDGNCARAIFTTICLAFNYEASTAATNEILTMLYEDYIDGNYDINYPTFETYMLKYII